MFLFLINCGTSFAQKMEGEFLILTFVEKEKNVNHKEKVYYWIFQVDSLDSKDFVASKLFLSNFSSNNLIDCCKGFEMDPFLIFQETEYNFETGYLKFLSEFQELLLKRKKLQTIKIKWESGQSKKVKIFGTALIGKFCFSEYHKIGKERDGYYGKVALPHSDIYILESFWKSKEVKWKNKNLFLFNYSIIN